MHAADNTLGSKNPTLEQFVLETSLSIVTTHAHACYSLPPVVKAFGGRNPGIQLSLLRGNPRQCGTFVIDGTAGLEIAAEIEAPPARTQIASWAHITFPN